MCVIQAPVEGFVEKGFEPVQEAFATNFERHGEVGAACCVHLKGRVVVDLWGGVKSVGGSEPYTGDTLQMVLSSTKGAVAVCAHMLAQQGQLDFDVPVVDYWPEFAAEGKDKIPVRWLFSHLRSPRSGRTGSQARRTATTSARTAGWPERSSGASLG